MNNKIIAFNNHSYVKETDLLIGKRIGHGAGSLVYLVTLAGQKLVYVRSKNLYLMEKEQRKGNKVGKLDEEAREGIKEIVGNYKKFAGLRFENHNIGIETYGLVINKHNEVLGYLAEHIQGKELYSLCQSGEITEKQLEQALCQLKAQLEIIHEAGLVHGDPHNGNAMVYINPDTQEIVARFIDFELPGSWKAEDDNSHFETSMVQLSRYLLKPEEVAKYREKIETERRADLFNEFKTTAGDLRRSIKKSFLIISDTVDRELIGETKDDNFLKVVSDFVDGILKEARMWDIVTFEEKYKYMSENLPQFKVMVKDYLNKLEKQVSDKDGNYKKISNNLNTFLIGMDELYNRLSVVFGGST
jgi:hypothetical protein